MKKLNTIIEVHLINSVSMRLAWLLIKLIGNLETLNVGVVHLHDSDKSLSHCPCSVPGVPEDNNWKDSPLCRFCLLRFCYNSLSYAQDIFIY